MSTPAEASALAVLSGLVRRTRSLLSFTANDVSFRVPTLFTIDLSRR
jgi:hypothetical protein